MDEIECDDCRGLGVDGEGTCRGCGGTGKALCAISRKHGQAVATLHGEVVCQACLILCQIEERGVA